MSTTAFTRLFMTQLPTTTQHEHRITTTLCYLSCVGCATRRPGTESQSRAGLVGEAGRKSASGLVRLAFDEMRPRVERLRVAAVLAPDADLLLHRPVGEAEEHAFAAQRLVHDGP